MNLQQLLNEQTGKSSTNKQLMTIFIAFLVLILQLVQAQVQVKGRFHPTDYSKIAQNLTRLYHVPPVNVARVLSNELLHNEGGILKGHKFGEPVNYRVDCRWAGSWQNEPNGRVWRASLRSTGASSLSVLFDRFYLPPGGEFYVIGLNETLGAFTGSINNRENGYFFSSPVPGDTIILEYWEPYEKFTRLVDNLKRNVEISIEGIVYGFHKNPPFLPIGTSGRCNLDVACPLAENLEDQINSVGLLLNDAGYSCTGTVLNNARQDGRQLFLTAHHCCSRETNNRRFLVYFNFQHNSCTADEGAGVNGEPEKMTVQGLKLLASWKLSDMALMEIEENIPDEYKVFYSGWSRQDSAPSKVYGIHHPSGDVKKISYYEGPVLDAYDRNVHLRLQLAYNERYHWYIPAWTIGVTERGSSGSPLFDGEGRVVGHLHKGASNCQNPKGYDLYGALRFGWRTSPKPDGWMAPHLDPDERHVVAMDGNYFTTNTTKPHIQKMASRAIGLDYY